jgi:CHAT domain-containing protein
MVLNGKSLVIDVLVAERTAAFCSDDEDLMKTVAEHTDVCSRISNLTLAAGQASSGGNIKDNIEDMYRIKNDLETELSYQCAAFEQSFSSRLVSIDDISRTMAEGSALWELVKYMPFESSRDYNENTKEEAHYLAVVILSTGETSLVDLGGASLIDALVLECRNKIQEAGREIYLMGRNEEILEDELSSITGKLHELIWAPLEDKSEGAERLYIDPDGMLNLIPFEILKGTNDRYVIEDYKVTYLSSGRDLIRFEGEVKAPENIAVILADPDYDGIRTSPIQVASIDLHKFPASLSRGPWNSNGCMTSPFGFLPATGVEAKRLEELLLRHADIEVARVSGIEARETYLKNLTLAPRILHLCSNETLAGGSALDANPLIYSGLALAGANWLFSNEKRLPFAVSGPPDDGFLTALEVSGLNLVGTDLVVLSACQTGVGDVQTGEGVFGLRRAFQHAGASSIVMGMFAVPDQSTVTLMQSFYNNWLSGEFKSYALRNASLSILQERRKTGGAAPPLFWGGFILVGDPN